METAIQPVSSMAIPSPPVDPRQLSTSVIRTPDELQLALPKWLELLDRGTADHNAHKISRKNLFLLEEQPGLVPRILLVWRGDKLICVAPFYEILRWGPA